MCGIFGIITSRNDVPSEELTRTALSRLAHRGPDGEGVHTYNGVTLGHRRLSIIDLTTGAQPMKSEDGRLCITYNGEIYNYRELREELKSSGYQFQSSSDTEVLLAAYMKWGTDCLAHLRGMYAFVLADFEQEEIFLARDSFGQKPFFYRTAPGCFAFSSELPALVDMPPLPPLTVDPEAIPLFFRYQYIPHPHTIYTEVRKLPPGTAMLVDFQGTIKRQWRYSDFTFAPRNELSIDTALDDAEMLLQDAVHIHTRADVPIGVFLSGGIDSTLVAMNLVQTVGSTIPAFTIAFQEESFSELEYAQTAANLLGLKLHVTVLEDYGLERLGEILSYYGEPFGDSSVLPTWHVCQAAREHVKVVLSGDGGDELFGGYNTHTQWIQHHGISGFTHIVRSIITGKPRMAKAGLRMFFQAKNLETFWHKRMSIYSDSALNRLLVSPWKEKIGNHCAVVKHVLQNTSRKSGLDVLQSLDIATYLPGCMMPKVDITSMSLGLEVRTPFLDSRLAALAASLPANLRATEQELGKVLLKRLLLKHHFPRSLVYRKKQGFGLPINFWFMKGGKARILLEALLEQYRKELSEYLNMEEVQYLLARHSLQTDESARLWLIMAFCFWLSNCQKVRIF